MNPLNHAIGFEDEKILCAAKFNDGAIIANEAARLRQTAQQQREQRIFADLAQASPSLGGPAQFHC